MAKPVTQRWSAFTLWVGDGASPEVFEALDCGLTAKSIAFSTETGDVTVPDCDDPDAPSWTERVPRAYSANITGSGVMAEETLELWSGWFFGGQAKNAKVILNTTNPITIAGSFIFTSFEVTGNEGDGKVQVSVAFQNDGEVTWVQAP